MCGLIAYYMTSGRPLEARLLEDMTNTLEHRGVDDYGFCFVSPGGPVTWRNGDRPPPMTAKGVAMGHRRLSIFDLSEAGRQPYLSDDGRLALVFNGEIYNFLELRDELIALGFHFTTDCDTEVLLKAFQKWGTDCFRRFNGVWSVVIWDNEAKELVVSRDRMGEKPLLYTEVDGDWIFASEVKALLKHPKVRAQPNEQSLLHFIASGAVPRGENTYFSGIKAVEPGTFMTIGDHGVTSSMYWDLAAMEPPLRTDRAATAQELDALLTDAVKLRLRGDVRVGAMLSGGMDSTSVISSIATVLNARYKESRAIGNTLKAFTASFPGLEIDETDRVEELCRLIEISVSKVFPVEQDDIEERLNKVAWHLESPFWSPAIIVHDTLMNLVRSNGIKVVLDGHGSDEIFGGYDWLLDTAIKDNFHNLHLREALGNLIGAHRIHGRNFFGEALQALVPNNFPGRYRLENTMRRMRGKQMFWHSGLFHEELGPRAGSRVAVKGRSTLERDLKILVLQNNVPRWVGMNDNICMASSVMSRSPFLDYRLIEFAFSLDNSLKIRDGVTKHVLRDAKREQLPASIVNGVQKIQYSGPGPQWLNGPLKGMALSLKDSKKSKLSEFLRTDALSKIVDDFYGGNRLDTHPLCMWRILNSESWLRAYF